ncbi:MAG: hypothetical protein KKF56_03410 [Nanoarchaeota archaeon]|nr:hypothetical protein [Nanoarchaeota archaeon]
MAKLIVGYDKVSDYYYFVIKGNPIYRISTGFETPEDCGEFVRACKIEEAITGVGFDDFSNEEIRRFWTVVNR